MNSNAVEQIARYELQRPVYQIFTTKIDHLIRSLLEAHDIKFQIVESRAKTVESFREKITRRGKSYDDPVNEIPDLCGSRVIVYYADDVVRVADIIKAEFTVIEEELAHQQDSIDSDRFGYLSAHYVVRLSEGRRNFAEWSAVRDLRAEIQIRTVIQHAWSAVSHALQYKQEVSVPSKLRRRLHRIAGLFELADEEFVGIRDQRLKLEKVTSMAFAIGNKALPLTNTSIVQMIINWEYLEEAKIAAQEAGFAVTEAIDEDGTIRDIYEIAQRLGINDIEGLEQTVSPPNYDVYKVLANMLHSTWTISVDFLFFFLLLDRHPNLLTVDDLIGLDWGDDRASDMLRLVKGRQRG